MSLKGIFSKQYSEKNKKEAGISEQYVKDEVAKIREEDVEIVMDNEEAISEKLSNAGPLRKYAELGKIMIGMLKDVKNGVYPQIPWFTIATVALTLLYILNPLDIIPDFIPGLGYIDDMAVLSLGVGWIESDLHRYLDWKIQEGKGL